MGEIRIVGPGKTRGYPYPVCKKIYFQSPKSYAVTITTSLCSGSLMYSHNGLRLGESNEHAKKSFLNK